MTPAQRLQVAQAIVHFEARRDNKGRLKVYQIPSGDGGGKYEIAGINVRFHRKEAAALKALIEAGKQKDAEQRAVYYIATYTDAVAAWTRHAALEAFLRDCCFNRGAGGAAMILQIALGVVVDGGVGPKTLAAADAIREVDIALRHLRSARDTYEREHVGRGPRSKFWAGLVNRWNDAYAMAQAYL
jgi:lysozyme family protein